MEPKQDVKVDDTWKIDGVDISDSNQLSNLDEKDNELLSEGKLITKDISKTKERPEAI